MRVCFALVLAVLASPVLAAESAVPAEDRWAADMRRFDADDAKKPTPPNGVVFVGSSSIRMWDLKASFPDAEPLNRGFGGSELADSVRHVDRLVLRHNPRVVVLYAGDNDVANRKTPEMIIGDFKEFVAAVRKKLPKTKIVYICIKPSIARWQIAEPMRQANAGVKAICDATDRCEFIDVWTPMLDEKGEPRDELYVWDGLHMTPAGYEIWTKLVGPHIE